MPTPLLRIIHNRPFSSAKALAGNHFMPAGAATDPEDIFRSHADPSFPGCNGFLYSDRFSAKALDEKPSYTGRSGRDPAAVFRPPHGAAFRVRTAFLQAGIP
jgi:hypothetical protein